jgi:alkylation response protein AidB-like acyl-CoA dehydrogenase
MATALQRFLPRFASGELRGGLALAEPDCGADLQAIRSRARRDGHYVINGTKSWITNSVEGSCLTLLVKTDPRCRTAPPPSPMTAASAAT